MTSELVLQPFCHVNFDGRLLFSPECGKCGTCKTIITRATPATAGNHAQQHNQYSGECLELL
jgi:hypothetical protein